MDYLDSCNVNNGGCDTNADCSHDSNTNAVVCSCKTGFVSNQNGTSLVCKGTINEIFFSYSH